MLSPYSISKKRFFEYRISIVKEYRILILLYERVYRTLNRDRRVTTIIFK